MELHVEISRIRSGVTMELHIEVSRVRSGLYRVHVSRSGQSDMYVQAKHIRVVRAMVKRVIEAHEASPYVQGLRLSGLLAEDEFAGAHIWRGLLSELSERADLA